MNSVVEECKMTYSDCKIMTEDTLHISEEFKTISLRCLRWILDGYEYIVLDAKTISTNTAIAIDVFFKISKHQPNRSCITFTFNLDPNMPFQMHKYTYIGDVVYRKLSRRLKSFHDEFEKTYSCLSEFMLQLDLMGV